MATTLKSRIDRRPVQPGRLGRRARVAAAVGILAALAVGVAVGGGAYRERPAPPEVLERIAAKNREAATVAAANMKADSQVATAAADARLRATEAQQEGREEPGSAD